MKIYHIKTDGKASSTGAVMRAMVRKYYLDMVPYASLSAIEMFTVIKNLPYRPDPPNVETLMRPKYTMTMQGYGGDCDCKALALAAWAYLQKIPYRFIAIRRPGRAVLHHVAIELYMEKQWIFFDPTYRFNSFGEKREEAERVII
jgi:hypothetical protein